MLLALAAIGLQAFGQIKQGQEEEAMARYNSGLLDMQASTVEANRVYSSNRQQEQIKEAQSRAVGTAAKQGANWSSTSRMMLLNKNYYNMQVDSHIMDYNAMIEARNLRSQAAQTRKAGANAMKASMFGTGASLMSGIGGRYPQIAGTKAGTSVANTSAGSTAAGTSSSYRAVK